VKKGLTRIDLFSLSHSPSQRGPSPGEKELPEVAHEGLIAEKAHFAISQLPTKIGICSDEDPTWSWCIGCSGKIQWMSSPKDISARTEDNAPWFHNGSTKMADLLLVEALLVQGRWPEMSDQIWRSEELKVAIQVVKKPTMSRGSGKRKRSSGPKRALVEGWECGSYVLKHNAIGGVTNQSYLVRWRVKKGSTKPVFSLPPNPSNCTLKRCLAGATLEGVRATEPP
jgi:hypothetical protein